MSVFEKVKSAILAAVRGRGSSWRDAYLDALSRQALRAVEGGAVPEAEASCLYVLARNPAQGRALECMGAIAARRKDWEKANTDLRAALAALPDDASVLGRLAEVSFLRGHIADAATFAARALKRDSEQSKAVLVHGRVLARRGDFQGAIPLLERAARLQPSDPSVWSELGNARARLSQLNEARDAFDRVLALEPGNADAHVALGDVYLAARHTDEARAHYRQALLLSPDSVPALSRLGAAAAQAGDAAEAGRLLSRASDLAPGELEPLINLGLLNQEAGRIDQALDCYRRARAIDPICVEAHMYAGLAHLSRGALDEGWDGLEWRLRLPSLQHLREGGAPLWRGEDLAGRTILLQREPGVSDHVQFLRYVPKLVSSGARVAVETFPEMQRLVARMPGVQGTLAGNDEPARAALKVDLRCPVLSLAHRFRTTTNTIPASVPYFTTDAAGVANWKARFGDLSPGTKVGFTWADGSVPLDDLLTILAGAKGTFVCLQPLPPQARAVSGLVDWTANMRDFADMADLISVLDVVIGPPAPATHLSGAMGKPTWILIAGRGDWRWSGDANANANAWYPTARVFRQGTPGSWAEVSAALSSVRPS